jgi:electron transport complex protein RnfD
MSRPTPHNTSNAIYMLAALLPGTVATAYYAGLKWQQMHLVFIDFSASIKIGIAIGIALVVNVFMQLIKRQSVLEVVKNPEILVAGLLLALFLPNDFAWWQVIIAITAAIIGSHYLFNNYFHTALLGYLFALALFPTAMGLSFIARNDFFDSHRWVVNAAFGAGGLYLIYSRLIDWRLPLALLIVFTGLLLSYKLYGLDQPFSWMLVSTFFTPAFIVSTFFVAPFIIGHEQSKALSVIAGVVIALLLLILNLYGRYPDSLPIVLLAFNIVALALTANKKILPHSDVSELSAHPLLAPLLSVSVLAATATSFMLAVCVGLIVTLIYLATQSIVDVTKRFFPEFTLPALIMALTVFFSAYIGLGLHVYWPALSLTLDGDIPLIALGALILNFSNIFTGNTQLFTMSGGLKTSVLFFVLLLLVGTVNQVIDMARVFPWSLFLLLALIALYNSKKLSVVIEPEHKPNRRVRTTGTIK